MPMQMDTSITLISTTTLVDMKTAGNTILYIVPTGKTLRITNIIVRDPTASLAGGTSYSITQWRQAFSLAALTLNFHYTNVYAADLAAFQRLAAATTVNFTVTTGSTLAATATIDLFGYTT